MSLKVLLEVAAGQGRKPETKWEATERRKAELSAKRDWTAPRRAAWLRNVTERVFKDAPAELRSK